MQRARKIWESRVLLLNGGTLSVRVSSVLSIVLARLKARSGVAPSKGCRKGPSCVFHKHVKRPLVKSTANRKPFRSGTRRF
jgi:hypothetical protein